MKGMACKGNVRHGMTRKGMAWIGKERHDMERKGNTCQGMAC
jgi:hypothetical protein